MTKQKTLITIVAAALLVGAVHNATAGPRNGAGNGKGMRGQSPRMVHMQQSLGLSEAQISQIREIRANGGGRDEIRGVLTEEQRSMMDAHRAARQSQGIAPGGPRNNADGAGYRGGNAGNPPAEPDPQ